MNNLPAATSQIQIIILALTAVALLGVIAVLGMLWRLRGPVNTMILIYLQSDDGQKAIAAGLRAYLSLPEGATYMEGVINGKIRREIAIHDTAIAAHLQLLKLYATELELNGVASVLRQRIENLEHICTDGREKVLGELKKIKELVEEK